MIEKEESVCSDCTCVGCHKEYKMFEDECTLKPTKKQRKVILNSSYSVHNVSNKKEASSVIEMICNNE